MPVIPKTKTNSIGEVVVLTDVTGGGVPGLPSTDGRLLYNIADYAGKFESATIGTGDIGNGLWGWWWNTSLSKMFMVRNRGGTLYAVEANPLP